MYGSNPNIFRVFPIYLMEKIKKKSRYQIMLFLGG